MRRPRKIAVEEENFRIEDHGGIGLIRRDPVETEPVGTIILLPYRVIAYDRDCDGSLMARLEALDLEFDDPEDPIDSELQGPEGGRYAGVLSNIGLYPSTGFVVTVEELNQMKEATS